MICIQFTVAVLVVGNKYVYAIHDMQIIYDSECFKIKFSL